MVFLEYSLPYSLLGNNSNDAEAVSLYRQAAAQGNALAHGNLGQMYEQGRGVTRDLGEAQRWYVKAAELYPSGPKRTEAIEARDRVARQVAANQATTSLPNDMSNAVEFIPIYRTRYL